MSAITSANQVDRAGYVLVRSQVCANNFTSRPVPALQYATSKQRGKECDTELGLFRPSFTFERPYSESPNVISTHTKV